MRRTSIIGAQRGAAVALTPLLAAGLLALAAGSVRADERLVDPDRSWLLGAQLTTVAQGHPAVPGPYADPETSFGPGGSLGWSLTASLLGGAVPWTGATAVAMAEYANGRGMPNSTGLAGYPDADLLHVRPGAMQPYLARLYLQQVFPIGGAAEVEREEEDPESRFLPGGPFALRRGRPSSRLEITAGRLAANDVFDLAQASSDPRHRFMNRALVNQGAWDIAADVRGYTWGLFLALETPGWALRGGLALVPTLAGGSELDWDLRHHRSEMVEGEMRWRALGGAGSARLLLYVDRARMGSYRDALAATAPGTAPRALVYYRQVGAVKYGAGLLLQQEMGPALAFLRYGWNDGETETFSFSECDRSFSAAVELRGRAWGLPGDRAGLGLAVGALSPDHAAYLAAGGRGIQLGDGALRPAWETVLEIYYAFRLARFLELTADAQGVLNPGMNGDRGPTLVAGLRLHAHL